MHAGDEERTVNTLDIKVNRSGILDRAKDRLKIFYNEEFDPGSG